MSTPAPNPPPAPRRSLPRRILRALGLAFGAVAILIMALWCATLLYVQALPNTTLAWALAIAFALLALALLVFLRPRRRGVIAFLILFALTLGWFFTIRASGTRNWQPDVARQAAAEIAGDLVTIRGVRNFIWRSETDFTPRWEDRTYDLSKIRSADYILSYWGPKAIAHSMLSFGFDDGQQIAFSIETRKEGGEKYSAIQGFFRQYELTYIGADERDLLGLRTNVRGEDVYVYRTRSSPAKARAVFLGYIAKMNELAADPEWYNALTDNCVTGLYTRISAYPPYPKWTIGVIFNGYSDRLSYDNGGFDHSVPFERLKEMCHINARAKATAADAGADGSLPPDFSQRIREGVPVPTVRE